MGATWHARPRGRATPAWRGGDTWHAYLYLLVTIGVIVHISILYSEFKLTPIFNASYILDMLL